MSIPFHFTACVQPSRRRSLPLFLYDLTTASRVLPPDTVVPEQFYPPLTGVDSRRGEVALMRAVLEDALGCMQKPFVTNARRARRLADEAEEWVFADDSSWPFSFINICAVLGLEPDYLRRGLRLWSQRSRADPPKRRHRTVLSRPPLKIAA